MLQSKSIINKDMLSKDKNLSMSLKTFRMSKGASSRPQSGHVPSNRRDPNWMKLFNAKSTHNVKFKPSKLYNYSIRPKSPSIEINPKFSINAMPLFKVLVKEPPTESFSISEKYLPLQKIPEFSQMTERNMSLSRFSAIKSNNQLSYTSRPSTAKSKNTLKETITERPLEFLPDKGTEFVSEVLKIWKNMDRNKEKLNNCKNEIEEEELSVDQSVMENHVEKHIQQVQKQEKFNNIVLKIPKTNQEINYHASKSMNKKSFSSRNLSKNNNQEKEDYLIINAQQAVLTNRPVKKSILQISSSKEFSRFSIQNV